MMLRSWIDTYEEAVTNHYSQELRSRLERVKIPATCQVKPKDVNGDRLGFTDWQMSFLVQHFYFSDAMCR